MTLMGIPMRTWTAQAGLMPPETNLLAGKVNEVYPVVTSNGFDVQGTGDLRLDVWLPQRIRRSCSNWAVP
jgi:hypothetical protein